MFVVLVVATFVLAWMLVVSANWKVSRHEKSIAVIHEMIGVPVAWFNWLAAAEYAAAFGVIVGLFWAPIGIAAAVGAVAYFTLAVISHLRVGDTAEIRHPLIVLAMSVAVLVLRVVTL